MEWLLWLVGVPVVCLLLLWAASKFTFPEKQAGSNGASGVFDVFNTLYDPSSSAARTELDEQKRRIVESAQGQDKDPLAGFHPSHPSHPSHPGEGSDDVPPGEPWTPR